VSQTQTPGSRNNSLAFFDIDGTLTDGFTIFSFAEFLYQQGCFNRSGLDLMQQDKSTYQASARGEQDYHEFAVKLVDHYALGLKDWQVEQIQSLSPAFLEHALQNQVAGYRIHGFAKVLLEMINPIATTIAISGSPLESLSALVSYLGFQELNSTLINVDDGRYTGQVDRNLAISESKRHLVGAYLVEGVNLEASFAFGDSVQDVPILEAVGNAFVLGSNSELQSIGRRRGWAVLSAQDDIVGVVKSRITSLFGR
jgi:HAD superfamily phosphoserine phosphatase-like hydrolase